MKGHFREVFIVSWLVLLLASACELTIPATRTPSTTVGSTVFAAIRWRDQSRAIDVVFVPDDGYGDMTVTANRQNFLNDVADAIDEGFWQNNAVFNNLGLFNFWFMTSTGDIQPPATGICPTVTWPNLTDAAFAEMVVLLHRDNRIRDCGGGSRASSLAGSGNEWIIVHESGHAVFGLPDEYCCDGGYWNISPILYTTQVACTSDPANAAWRNCQSYTANNGTVWWRSEDSIADLMSAGGPPVLEMGPADWVIMRNVLIGFSPSVGNPAVFAPAAWDWP